MGAHSSTMFCLVWMFYEFRKKGCQEFELNYGAIYQFCIKISLKVLVYW